MESKAYHPERADVRPRLKSRCSRRPFHHGGKAVHRLRCFPQRAACGGHDHSDNAPNFSAAKGGIFGWKEIPKATDMNERTRKNTREIEGVTWTLSLTGLVSRRRLVAALQPRLLPLNHVTPNMSAAAAECSMIWRLSMQTNNERIMTSYRCPWVDGLVAWTHWTTSAINRSSLWHKTSLMSSEDDRSMLTDVRFKMPRLSNKRNRLRHLTDNVRLKETFSSAPPPARRHFTLSTPCGRPPKWPQVRLFHRRIDSSHSSNF